MSDVGLVTADRARPARAGRPRPAGVVIIDDSLIVRRLVGRVIDAEPDLEVIGEADDGRHGLELIRSADPAVVVLDLEMPGLDGYAVLEAVSAEQLTCPIIVFANIEPGEYDRMAAATKAAGAELVAKPTGVADAAEALARIRSCLLAPLRRLAAKPRPAASRSSGPRPPRTVQAVVIASSTGGPNALEEVLGHLADLRVPIFIVQHIADGFSGRLADRLDMVCRFPVHEAVDGERPEPGCAYVAPGTTHLAVEGTSDSPVLRLLDLPPVNSCRPSADVLFRSSAEVYGGDQLGVVLTGMGRDGFEGCRALVECGASILVQDEETSVVWGMPGTVATSGLADEVLPIDQIASRIQSLSSASAATRRNRIGPDR